MNWPADVRPLALIKLAIAAIGDAVEPADRLADLGEVLGQEIIAVEFHLDGVEHVGGVPLVGADQTDELAVAVEHGPDAGTFADRGLAQIGRAHV